MGDDSLDHDDSIDFTVSPTNLVQHVVGHISGNVVQGSRGGMRPDDGGFCDLPTSLAGSLDMSGRMSYEGSLSYESFK